MPCGPKHADFESFFCRSVSLLPAARESLHRVQQLREEYTRRGYLRVVDSTLRKEKRESALLCFLRGHATT